MGPADSHRITRVPRYSGLRYVSTCFAHGALTLYGAAFQHARARILMYNVAVLLPRMRLDAHGLGSSPVARHYWGNHCYFLFLRVLRCFSSPRWPHALRHGTRLNAGGLSHSGTPGSMAICAYPGIFAAYHALLRLREPRHPPCALDYFLPRQWIAPLPALVQNFLLLFQTVPPCADFS